MEYEIFFKPTTREIVSDLREQYEKETEFKNFWFTAKKDYTEVE